MLKPAILYLVYCLSMIFTCTAQTSKVSKNANATLDLIVKNSSSQRFLLRNMGQNLKYEIIDSAILGNNGTIDTLHFEVNVTGRETHLTAGFSKVKLHYFLPVLSPGDSLKYVIDFNDSNDIKFCGSARTSEFHDFLLKRDTIVKDRLRYAMALKNKVTDSVLLRNKIDSIDHQSGIFLKNTIFNTQCANVAIIALMNSQNGVVEYTKDELQQLRENFKDDAPTLKQIDINDHLQDRPQNKNLKPANGTLLTNFTLPDANGKLVNLNQFKGKYVLLDFWASWCGPCRKESPYLKQAYIKFGGNNFVILSVSIDENQSAWQKAISQDGTGHFIHVIDIRGKQSPIEQQYHIESIPSNFLLDPTGKLIDKDLRGQALITRISEVIK